MSDSNRRAECDRRQFMAGIAATSLAARWAGAGRQTRAAEAVPGGGVDAGEQEIRDYLTSLLPTREDVDNWLRRSAFPFSKYDAELGYLHVDRDLREGQDGSICRYRYDELDARQMIAHADRPCRINTYGNSFTSCEQVSDGETWQEVLASHLGEPVRNFGIGGYSVYQAYLRMLREEERAPAECIIFNIFDDDHCRNMLGWQRFKFGVNKTSINPTVPHVRVDLAAGEMVERTNPCPTPGSIDALCSLDSAYELFRNDFILKNRVAREAAKRAGRPVPPTDYDDSYLTRCGLFATTAIVDRVEEYAQKNGKQVLFVLSYSGYTIKQFIERGVRFDQPLVDHFNERKLPYVDLMQAHCQDAAKFKLPTDDYLSRYFIGHYNPLGNVFCAFALKDALVSTLDPKPSAYSS